MTMDLPLKDLRLSRSTVRSAPGLRHIGPYDYSWHVESIGPSDTAEGDGSGASCCFALSRILMDPCAGRLRMYASSTSSP